MTMTQAPQNLYKDCLGQCYSRILKFYSMILEENLSLDCFKPFLMVPKWFFATEDFTVW